MNKLWSFQSEIFSLIRLPLIVLVTYAHSYGGVMEGYSVLDSGWDTYEVLKIMVSQTLVMVTMPMFFVMPGFFFANVEQFNKEIYCQKIQRMVDDYEQTKSGPLSDYIFDNQDKLTQEQINSHLKTIHHQQLEELVMELRYLRQPALGAYADLFTCRAAQKMAELLAPIIAKNVDFEHCYQYGAWVKAMADMKLIRADKRNGSAIIRFVNKTFGEQIDKTTLFRCLSKEDDFKKIRDLYESILSVVSQEMGREPRFCILKKAFLQH